MNSWGNPVRDTRSGLRTLVLESNKKLLAEAETDRAATVNLEITHHALSGEELLRKLKTGESLSLTEIAYLQRSDDVSDDELARYFSDEEETVDDGRIQSKVTEF